MGFMCRLRGRRALPLLRARGFTTESVYAEQLQLKQIKSPAFYDLHAQDRNYFYHVDLQGQLFLEDTVPKNIATSLKSHKFLRFFFGQLRPNPNAGKNTSLFHDYDFISPCGPEMNYIKAADTPFVLTELKSDDTGAWTLVSNAGQEVPFNPAHVAMSSATHRLYHWLETKHVAQFALLRSQVAVEVSQSIDFREDGHHLLEWNDRVYPVALDVARPPSLSPHSTSRSN